MGSVGPFEILLVGLIALIALGPKRLPEVAKSLGKGMREFKSAMDDVTADDKKSVPPASPAPPAQVTQAPPPPGPPQPPPGG
jgi:sec-independent protein translocase protein TatA